MTKEGPVLVNPFQLDNAREKLLVEQTVKEMARKDREFGKWLLRTMRTSHGNDPLVRASSALSVTIALCQSCLAV